MLGASIENLIRYSKRPEWAGELNLVFDEFAGPACREANIELADIGRVLGAHSGMNLWGAAFEELTTRKSLLGRNMVDDYLRKRGFDERVQNKRYMTAMRGSVLSLYEASAVEDGVSCLVRDLIRGGEPVRVYEKSGTMGLKPWTLLAARVVEVNGTLHFTGAIFVVERDVADAIIAHFGVGKDATAAAPYIVGAWLRHALRRALNPEPIRLFNTDGDLLVQCRSEYPYKTGKTRDDVRAKLALDTNFEQTSIDQFERLQDNASLHGADPREPVPEGTRAMIMSSTNGAGQGEIAVIMLNTRVLVLTTNSRERHVMTAEMLTTCLGPLIGQPKTEETSGAELLTQSKDQTGVSRAQARAVPPTKSKIPIATQVALVKAAMDKQMRDTLDRPLKSLGGKSPRHLAAMPGGETQVVNWLKSMENGAIEEFPYDFGWVWHELKLDHLRV